MVARWCTTATVAVLAGVVAMALQRPPAAADAPGYEVVSPGTLKPGDPIPAPQAKVVLTLRGAKAAGADPLRFDTPTLEKIGLIRFTSTNRWYDEPVTYEGVLGSAFLDVVGVPAGATVLRMVALNDYVVNIPIADLRRWPVMLALKLNGEYMSVREKGPIWVVYPNHLREELGGPAYQGKWIWQLREIIFE